MRAFKSILEYFKAFASFDYISQIFSKKLLTFDFSYGIRIKRFEDIVLQVQEKVKIFYLIGGTHNVHYTR
jgi:hypothetical protein